MLLCYTYNARRKANMQLTRHTDYAFRVLIYLASQEAQDLTTIQDISSCFDISKNHVMKVVQTLVKAGFVHSVRGQSGGLRLACAPDVINVRKVIEATETVLAPVNCKVPVCRLAQNCQLQGVLFQAQEAYLVSVAQYTLADLVRSQPMKTLL